MDTNNLLVLICKSYLTHPKIEIKVMDIHKGEARLGEDGLELSVDSRGTWRVKREEGNFQVTVANRKIGDSKEFFGTGANVPNYFVGVYNRMRDDQMQKMVDLVRYQEGVRHSGISVD